MKTYLLDTINRIKRFSEVLDAQTALCNRPWVVFNDTGDREVLIFNSDGSVLITVNGIGVRRTWQWIPANRSLIINQHDDSIVMLHPDYFNNSIIALNRDGTQEYAFLIDDNISTDFAPRTLHELQTYFHEIETDMSRRQQDENGKEPKDRIEKEMMAKAMEMDFGYKKYLFAVFALVGILMIIFLPFCSIEVGIALFVILIIILLAVLAVDEILQKDNVKKFIANNPHDPVVPYLKKYHQIQ